MRLRLCTTNTVRSAWYGHLKLFPKRSINISSLKNAAVNLSHTIYEPQKVTNPPLLITHGLLGSKNNWNAIAKAVSKVTDRQVVVFDARNHGDSPKTPEHSYDLMAEDVIHLAKTLNIEKFSLMGHSMGGRTTMVLALRCPEILEKIVVVDVSPVSLQSSFHSEMLDYIKTMMAINFDLGSKIVLSEARKIGHDALKPLVPNDSIRAFLLTNLAEQGGEIYWKPNLQILSKAIESIGAFPPDLLSKTFDSPTLFIRGEKSTYIPDKDIPPIKKLFPAAKIDTIKNSGHWPHADNIKDFLGSFIAFLKS